MEKSFADIQMYVVAFKPRRTKRNHMDDCGKHLQRFKRKLLLNMETLDWTTVLIQNAQCTSRQQIDCMNFYHSLHVN